VNWGEVVRLEKKKLEDHFSWNGTGNVIMVVQFSSERREPIEEGRQS